MDLNQQAKSRPVSYELVELFGRERLEYIQNSLSKATGLAFVTVDYKGDPVTECSFFTDFCRMRRNDDGTAQRCKSSDAFGAIQAAVSKKPMVYFCPCGLMEVAIPLTIHGQYLGGFIGGQVRCQDAPRDVYNLQTIMPDGSTVSDCENEDLMERIPIVSYEKFMDIANLVFLVINQLGEHEMNKQINEEGLTSQINALTTANQLLESRIHALTNTLDEITSSTNPYHTLDLLSIMIHTASLEDAPKTEEALFLMVDYIKHTASNHAPFHHLQSEVDCLSDYLRLQKVKYGDKLTYQIKLDDSAKIKKIPNNILMPFIQNALYNGVLLQPDGGNVELQISLKKSAIVVTISDNGPGLNDDELAVRFEEYQDMHQGRYIKMGMDASIIKLTNLANGSFTIDKSIERNRGRKYTLSWSDFS